VAEADEEGAGRAVSCRTFEVPSIDEALSSPRHPVAAASHDLAAATPRPRPA